jgi:hypothetical protein
MTIRHFVMTKSFQFLPAVRNRKEARPDGITIYRMSRTVGDRVYGYDVAVTDLEMQYRSGVAHKLRNARRALRAETNGGSSHGPHH